jgi:hypothetical protein
MDKAKQQKPWKLVSRQSRQYADLLQGSWVMLPTNDILSLSRLSDLPRFLLRSRNIGRGTRPFGQ